MSILHKVMSAQVLTEGSSLALALRMHLLLKLQSLMHTLRLHLIKHALLKNWLQKMLMILTVRYLG